jgi:hypothetical protein
MPRSYPEPASTTAVVLLTLGTIAAGAGAAYMGHLPLALATLVSGTYVLHLLGIRRSASDAVIFHSMRLREEAKELELEYESRLRDLDRLQPELERERKRIQDQWEHLKGLVEERESRRNKVRGIEQELEKVRAEAAKALESARRDAQAKSEKELDLQKRIAELEAVREEARRREAKMQDLTEQVEDLEAAQRDAEMALAEIASRHPRRSPGTVYSRAGHTSPEPPGLRAWQFIAYKKNRGVNQK